MTETLEQLEKRFAELEDRPILRGRDGRDGKDGRHGKDGLPGRDGKDGEPGKDGAKGEVGPRGPAGNVEAATHQAEQTAAKIAEESTRRLFNERTASIVDTIRKDYERALADHDSNIKQHLDSFRANFENEIAAIVFGLFKEYRVLDHTGRPIGSTT